MFPTWTWLASSGSPKQLITPSRNTRRRWQQPRRRPRNDIVPRKEMRREEPCAGWGRGRGWDSRPRPGEEPPRWAELWRRRRERGKGSAASSLGEGRRYRCRHSPRVTRLCACKAPDYQLRESKEWRTVLLLRAYFLSVPSLVPYAGESPLSRVQTQVLV